MQTDQLRSHLESLDTARLTLTSWGLRDLQRGWHITTRIADAIGFDGLCELWQPLGRLLPRCPDPDMALNSLERFLATPAGAQQLTALLDHRARTLETFLQLVSTSQSLSDQLASNPDSLEMIRIPLRRTPSLTELRDQLHAEAEAAYEDSTLLRVFRKFRQKQTLRIGTNDVIRDRPLEEITRDVSRVADAALDVALEMARRNVSKRFGEPTTSTGEPARCVILGFGKLGGEELNYSSDIDLMVIYDEEGATEGKRVSHVENSEFFARVVGEIVRLLSSHTDRGQAYRIDLRLRPEGHRGALARSLASTLSYYDTLGRTWERQALIKARPVAGDLELGRQFLRAMEPWIYRKYLSFAEINEIKAMKRRIEQKSLRAGSSDSEVKTGHGGIRDIEFTIQFLQLLNGGRLPEVRERNTLLAMAALERAGCLTDLEWQILADAYRFLRKTEHRLQLLFDLQTHRLPSSTEELTRLALRMGYEPSGEWRVASGESEDASSLATRHSPLATFLNDYKTKTDVNRKILDHLLHQTFPSGDSQDEPESDLILDPEPEPETIKSVLGRYGFHDVMVAYQNLTELSRESVPFLSTPRCRHFLASIAPALLRALRETADPDLALTNLEKVTASLGAKAVLWELFSFNKPSLKLYVEMCAWSGFLSDILTNNPGMIDDLLDSLVLNQPRTLEELKHELGDLCRNASDLEPILHSFQDKELLRIGVRDILSKDSISATTRALSDLAETVLLQISSMQYPPLLKRFGLPTLAEGPRAGHVSRWCILALGKLGGRELSYHSDLDLIFVYEGDGRTQPPPGSSRWDRFELTDNFHFFTEVAQRIIKATSFMGPMGRLYQIDMRLRPTGKSGSLVIPLAEFRRYYEGSGAHLWERQSLTRGRVVFGEEEFAAEVMAVVAQGAYGLKWRPEMADEIVHMRERIEASRRSDRDIKRGPGGLIDVEFLVQLMLIKHGKQKPRTRTSNTWQALEELREAELLSAEDHDVLRSSYDFLRRVEGRLRIVHNRSLDELPDHPEELEKLARRLGQEVGSDGLAGQSFLKQIQRHTCRTREVFEKLVQRERAGEIV